MGQSTGAGLRPSGVERRRRQVIAAVRERLVGAGYEALSLAGVAADAGITRVTIYRQFGSKLGLLQAVAEDLTLRGRAAERLDAAVAIPDAPTAFRTMISELCRFWNTDPPLFRRLLSLAEVDPEARTVIETRDQSRHEGIRALVGRLAGEGRLRAPFGPAEASSVIIGVTSFATCDQMSRALGIGLTRLPALLLALLDSVVDLQAPPRATAGSQGTRAR